MKRNRSAIPALLAVALAFAMVPVAAAQDDSGSPPCSSPEHRQFDFWLGDWVVQSASGEILGTNRIESILNGCVLEESWKGAKGSIGRSFNMYFRRDGRWHQSWVDGQGGRLDLAGGWVEGAMVLSGSLPGRDGGQVLHEVAWTPGEDGTVLQRWRASSDGGETWNEVFVGTYVRSSGGSTDAR